MTPFSRTVLAPNVRRLIYYDGSPGSTTTIDAVQQDVNLSCSGIVKGDFKSPNAWSWTFSRRHRSGGSSRDLYPNRELRNDGPDLGPAAVSALTAVPASAYNKALEKLYDNIRGNVDLSVDLAEIGKTTRMIQNGASDVLKLATSWRRGLISGGKQVANAYLQYKYGIRPTMQTMHEMASRQLTLATTPVTFRSRAGYKNVSQRVSKNNSTQIVSVENYDASRRCEISLTFSTSSTSISALSQFSSLNPLSIAWELTPGSFVADWFWDVGGYLRMAETALLSGLQFHSGYRTDSWRGFSRRTNSARYWTGYATHIHFTEGYLEEKGATRQKLAGMPFPELPRVTVDLGSSRLLSAAALLSQFVKAH